MQNRVKCVKNLCLIKEHFHLEYDRVKTSHFTWMLAPIMLRKWSIKWYEKVIWAICYDDQSLICMEKLFLDYNLFFFQKIFVK